MENVFCTGGPFFAIPSFLDIHLHSSNNQSEVFTNSRLNNPETVWTIQFTCTYPLHLVQLYLVFAVRTIYWNRVDSPTGIISSAIHWLA